MGRGRCVSSSCLGNALGQGWWEWVLARLLGSGIPIPCPSPLLVACGGSPLGERGLVLLARGSFVLPCARPAWPGRFRVGTCWPKAGSS